MAEPIQYTSYEWYRWRGKVVLLRRQSLKPIWGLCIFLACYLALGALAITIVLSIEEPAGHHVNVSPVWTALICFVSICFVYGFVRAYKTDEGILIPLRVWRIGIGQKLACQIFRDPQPTGMGGTLPGAPIRWLVLMRRGEMQLRLRPIYHEPDLLKINLALAGTFDPPVNSSH